MAGDDWSREEVELVVADYLEMFGAWCAGQPVSKAERRRQLQPRLNHRNDSSIDRKRSNVSAVIEKLGFHHLPGYKPLWNYQRILEPVVLEQVKNAPWLDDVALAAVQLPAVAHVTADFRRVTVRAPKKADRAGEPSVPSFTPVRRDYVEREARNRSLGQAGEEFAIEYEKWRLRELGEPALASAVDWVSKSQGDGLGYDVRSFSADGTPRHIEVKTTAFGAATPFFLSSVELEFAKGNQQTFHVYRLFEFRQQPRLFCLPGNPAAYCFLDPVSYRASFS